VLLLATGFAFGMLAKAKADDVTNGGDLQNPPPFDPSVENSGKRYDLFAKISWGVGGAAIVGGAVFYMLGRSAEQPRVSAVPQRGGAVFAWGLSW